MQWLKQDPRKNNDLQKQYTEDTLLSSTNPAKNRIRECWVENITNLLQVTVKFYSHKIKEGKLKHYTKYTSQWT